MQSGLPTLRRIRVLAALLLALACHTTGSGREPAQASPATLEGLVTRVADGDTLDVLDDAKASHRVRLLGIDAPEGGQPYGKVAKQALLDLVIRRRVLVIVQSQDRYHRSVGKVLLAGADINLELLREGLVWHYKHYAGDQVSGDARRYAQAEQDARQARVGLWADPHPTPPWEWRRSHPRTPRP